MPARVIHFGLDDCYRMPVLRAAGFEVKESNCLASLGFNLRNELIDAVIVSMDDGWNAGQAADMVRERTLAPVILFCKRESDLLERSKFDRVYASVISPDIWLNETEMLIQQSQSIQKEAARVR